MARYSRHASGKATCVGRSGEGARRLSRRVGVGKSGEAASCASRPPTSILRIEQADGGRRYSMCVPGCQEAVRHALSRRGFFKGPLAASFAATAVAPETAQAAPARRFTSTVDLTHTMSAEFPTFFGVPGIEMDKKFDLKKDGFNLYWWRIIEHAGTHLD